MRKLMKAQNHSCSGLKFELPAEDKGVSTKKKTVYSTISDFQCKLFSIYRKMSLGESDLSKRHLKLM